MRLLITGGAGFIGSNLAKLALANDVEVTILDDLSTGYRENIQDLDVTFIEGSILDVDAVRKSLVGVDSVIHLAALGSVPRSIQDPMASHAANATGTLTVLDEARQAGVKHFVVSSSSSVYGMNPALPKSEREWVRPMSPYAVSKLATEQYVLAYQQSFGMETLAFRFFNVYGPGQKAGHVYAPRSSRCSSTRCWTVGLCPSTVTARIRATSPMWGLYAGSCWMPRSAG